VYDAESGASLSQAHVYEAERHLGATSDTSGYYRLGVWIDSVRLAVSHLGYEPGWCSISGAIRCATSV